MTDILRLDAFMARANAAYYASHDPFADFTTAPEISQMFGELVGAWCAVVWRAMGAPDPVVLAEAGPGRGTLMEDALRVLGRVTPGLRGAARVALIESSARLRAVQAGRVPGAVFCDGLAELPAGPLLLVANEFLDALPIRQFVRRGTGWAERFVDGGRFVEQRADLDRDGAEGAVLERREAAESCVGHVARQLAAEGGAALFLDYGADGGGADTLQAIRDGAPADPLAEPGGADLTAHVDFAALAGVARAQGAAVHGPVPQGVLLSRLGLFQRTDRLARGQPPARAAALIAAAQRLAEPMHMGRLFKAMALAHPGLPTLPGFDP